MSEDFEVSNILFNDVALYHFINPTGTILTDIEEVNLSELISTHLETVVEWGRLYGLDHFDHAAPRNYLVKLESERYKAWEISSAIGFYGFVIGREMSQVPA